jgi:hypothetical protein
LKTDVGLVSVLKTKFRGLRPPELNIYSAWAPIYGSYLLVFGKSHLTLAPPANQNASPTSH